MKPARTCIVCGQVTRALEEHYVAEHYVQPRPWKIEKPSRPKKEEEKHDN